MYLEEKKILKHDLWFFAKCYQCFYSQLILGQMLKWLNFTCCTKNFTGFVASWKVTENLECQGISNSHGKLGKFQNIQESNKFSNMS